MVSFNLKTVQLGHYFAHMSLDVKHPHFQLAFATCRITLVVNKKLVFSTNKCFKGPVTSFQGMKSLSLISEVNSTRDIMDYLKYGTTSDDRYIMHLQHGHDTRVHALQTSLPQVAKKLQAHSTAGESGKGDWNLLFSIDEKSITDMY